MWDWGGSGSWEHLGWTATGNRSVNSMLNVLNKFLKSLSLFEGCCLRLSQPAVLNDPREALPELLLDGYSTEDRIFAAKKAAIYGLNEADAEIAILTPFPARRFDEQSFPTLWPRTVSELSSVPFRTIAEYDKAIALGAIELIAEQVNDSIGILSFSATENDVLWSHYADQHQGIMISFDPQHEFFGNHLKAVVYSNDPIKVSTKLGVLRLAGKEIREEDVLRRKTLPIPQELFLRKAHAWSYEQEVRFIRSLAQANRKIQSEERYPVYLLEIPAAAVRSLTFGYRAREGDINAAVLRIKNDMGLEHIEILKRERSFSGSEVRRI